MRRHIRTYTGEVFEAVLVKTKARASAEQ